MVRIGLWRDLAWHSCVCLFDIGCCFPSALLKANSALAAGPRQICKQPALYAVLKVLRCGVGMYIVVG